MIDGNAGTLADIKVADDGPFAMVRLSLDQKAVQFLMVRQGGR